MLRVCEAAHEGDALPSRIDTEDEHSAELLHGWSGSVVEERDRSVGPAACVVLPREPNALAERKVTSLAAEPPEDATAAPVDLIERVRVTRGDEKVPVRLHVDGVDVEVVPRRRLRALCRRGSVHVRLTKRDAGVAVPLEQHASGGDRDLLDDSLEDSPSLRSAVGREIHVHLSIDREERRISRRDQELVYVAAQSVTGVDRRDGSVGGVGDDVVAAPDSHGRASAPPGEDGLSAIALHAKVGNALRVERIEPDDVALIVDDHRSGLRDGHLRCEEDQARRGVPRGRLDPDDRRPKIGSRHEVLRGQEGRRGPL